MKTSILLLLVLLGFSNVGFSNPFMKVPEKIQTALKSNFEYEGKVKWFRVHGDYGARFEIDNKLHYAFFNENGALIEINAQVSYVDLKPAIKEELNAQYAHCYVKTAFRLVERNGNERFLIMLENMQTGEEYEVSFE